MVQVEQLRLQAVLEGDYSSFNKAGFVHLLADSLGLPKRAFSVQAVPASVMVLVNITTAEGTLTTEQTRTLTTTDGLTGALGGMWQVQSVEATTETLEVPIDSPLAQAAGLSETEGPSKGVSHEVIYLALILGGGILLACFCTMWCCLRSRRDKVRLQEYLSDGIDGKDGTARMDMVMSGRHSAHGPSSGKSMALTKVSGPGSAMAAQI